MDIVNQFEPFVFLLEFRKLGAKSTGIFLCPVAQYAGDADSTVETTLYGRLSVHGIAGQRLGHHAARNVEHVQQVVVPVERMDVEEHGA